MHQMHFLLCPSLHSISRPSDVFRTFSGVWPLTYLPRPHWTFRCRSIYSYLTSVRTLKNSRHLFFGKKSLPLPTRFSSRWRKCTSECRERNPLTPPDPFRLFLSHGSREEHYLLLQSGRLKDLGHPEWGQKISSPRAKYVELSHNQLLQGGLRCVHNTVHVAWNVSTNQKNRKHSSPI